MVEVYSHTRQADWVVVRRSKEKDGRDKTNLITGWGQLVGGGVEMGAMEKGDSEQKGGGHRVRGYCSEGDDGSWR